MPFSMVQMRLPCNSESPFDWEEQIYLGFWGIQMEWNSSNRLIKYYGIILYLIYGNRLVAVEEIWDYPVIFNQG